MVRGSLKIGLDGFSGCLVAGCSGQPETVVKSATDGALAVCGHLGKQSNHFAYQLAMSRCRSILRFRLPIVLSIMRQPENWVGWVFRLPLLARCGASQRAVKVSIDLAALRHIDDVVLHGGGELDAAHHSEIAQHGEDQDVFHAEIAAVKGVAVDLAGERLQIAVDLREQFGGFVEHLGDACADAGFFF